MRSDEACGASPALLVGSKNACHPGIHRPARREHRPRCSVLEQRSGLRRPSRQTRLPRVTGRVGARLHLDEDDQTHLDLWTVEAAPDLDAEVTRLIDLGAVRADWTYPDEADFVVLSDTEGNLFCVVTK